MDRQTADAQLEQAQLAPVLEGQVGRARELERTLLQSDIPALLAAKPAGACCGGGCGCGGKVQVLVRAEDVGRVRALLDQAWLEDVRREGAGLVQLRAVEPEGEPPCPACGTAAPLVEGACSDCGLQLA